MNSLRLAAMRSRPRRVVWLLVLLWMLNIFDLTYTILAYRIGDFEEMNPIASQMLQQSWMLIAFKLTGISLGTLILLMLRRHRLAELVSWLICLVYTALAFSWMTYYSLMR